MLTLLGNRYRIVGELGAGAMGRVFQAVDTRTGNAVAAKVMIADRDESLEMLLRFQQEGAVLSTLRHPNIVTVYGTFLEEGSCSIIMELLEGYSLADLMQREHLALDRVRLLGSQAALALGFAHGRGVIHRDVKPSNVMVIGADRVKVTDFGIARVADGGTLRTATGMSLGTPLYMSPEQIEGGKIDARSDIYSLGAVLFEMLAGRPPFEGRDPLSVAFKHVHTAPPRPSSLNADVPPAWESLILTMLEKNPSKRIQTAEEVAEALNTLSLGTELARTVVSSIPEQGLPFADELRTQLSSEPSRLRGVSPIEPEPVGANGAATAVAVPAPSDGEPTHEPAVPAGGLRPQWILPGAAALGVILLAAIAFLTIHSLGGSGQGTPAAKAGSFLRELGPVSHPEGIAGDSQGNLYVAAWGQNQIVKIAPDGSIVHRWGSQGPGANQFDGPTGVALDARGDIFVADSRNNRIVELSPSGAFKQSWGGPEAGSEPGQFSGVHGVAVDSHGYVYAADYGNNRIVKLSPSGSVVKVIGGPEPGSGGGQFDQPLGVAVDHAGNIYVADFNNSRIEKLNSNGRFVKQFTGFGNSTGLARPHGVAVDSHGNIYVADYQNNAVEEISGAGAAVHTTGHPGTGHGAFDRLAAVYVDPRGNVYAADSGNNRIQEFSPAG